MASMSFSLPKSALDQLKGFISLCKSKPEMIHNEELTFFREYLLSMGATLPPAPPKEEKPSKPEPEAKVPPPAAEEPETEMEVESEESDVELDMDGVIGDPKPIDNQDMGDPNKKELSDEEMDSFDEKRGEAMQAYSEGEWEKAIGLFTDAIKINPNSAVMFAKRGMCYLKISPQATGACVKDCTRAILLNPDNAAAYKWRGRAQRLLGNFSEAAKDLSTACKIDFDEQADEWLKQVQPNAKKLQEHQRKKERKVAEKELAARKERVRKAKEAQAQAAKEAENQGEDDMGPGMGAGGGMGGLGGLLNDPELMAAFSDPEVAAAFKDISSNPANIMKYQNNPKVMALVTKMASKMGGGGGGGMPGMMGGMPGMGGLGGMMGGLGAMFGGMGGAGAGAGGSAGPPPGASQPPPPKPSSTDDLD